MSVALALFPAHPLAHQDRLLWALGAVVLIALAPQVHAGETSRSKPASTASSSATSLRLTSPAGGLWVRGKAFGQTTQAESASLGGSTLPSWRLLGSYDLPRAGGLRASGGMIGVSRRTALGAAANQESTRWDTGLGSSWISGSTAPALQASSVSVPYAGVSYTHAGSLAGEGRLASSSWSFNVDLGVMALAPRSSVRLGSSITPQDRLDETLRSLKLSPLLQLGVSYSF